MPRESPGRHSDGPLCRFPPFPGRDPALASIRREKVNFQGPPPDYSLLEAGWAVLLRLYTGHVKTCFESVTSDQGANLATFEAGDSDTLQTIALRGVSTSCTEENADLRDLNTAVVRTAASLDSWTDEVLQENITSLLQPGKELILFQSPSGCVLVYMQSFMSAKEAKNVASTLSYIMSSDTDRVTIRNMSISPRDAAQIIRWNNKELVSERMNLVHDLFSARAHKQADSVAIDAWDGQMSYNELEKVSTTWGRQLQMQGISQGSWVLFCFEKSRLAVVCMLAILKAGGACVPVDPRYPTERVRDIIRTTNAKIALVGAGKTAALFESADAAIRTIDITKDIPSGLSNMVALSKTKIEDPAFGLFTSGSTGVPKCIVVTHSQICTGVQAYRDRFGVTAETRVLQFSSYTFDISIADTFAALFYGGTLCIPSEEDRMSNLQEYMVSVRPNWAVLTPTVSRFLDPAVVKDFVSTLIFTGEASRESDTAPWIEAGVNLYNVYGPAENTLITTATRVRKGESSNIGYGVNTRTWVTDVSSACLVPVGRIGELLIESGHLADKYLNNPDKTEAAFLSDVSWIPNCDGDSVHRGRRFYRTGDLVRYCDDGSLICVGRSDTQIKLAGQRVELGDVEAHLQSDPATSQAAVFFPTSGTLKARLTALLVVRGKDGTHHNKQHPPKPFFTQCPPDLVEYATSRLQQRLPLYMVPSTWLSIGYLPMSASGKLDRAALQDQLESLSPSDYVEILGTTDSEVGPGSVTSSVASGSDLRDMNHHDLLLSVCSRVLNLPGERLSFSKSFIHAGGDSITAMEVSSWMKRFTGKTIGVKDLLVSPSLSAAVSCIKTAQAGSPSFVAVRPAQRVSVSPIQRLFFETTETSKSWNHYHQSFLFRIDQPIKPQRLEDAISLVMQRHPMLQARFERTAEGTWYQYIPTDVERRASLEVMGSLSANEREAAMLRARRSINLMEGPLIRCQLFENNMDKASRSFFFVVIHHAVVDLVSWRLIMEELEAYLGTSPTADRGEAYQEPVPFLTWSMMQAEAVKNIPANRTVPLTHKVPAADFKYWGLRHDENVYGDTIERRIPLGHSVTEDLLYKCHHSLHTETIDVLLAAVLVSFRRSFLDRPVPAIFNEGHGREPWDEDGIDLSRTVGWFTTMSPIYVPEVSPGDILDVVRRVKDYRRATPNNGFDYFSTKYLTPSGHQLFENHLPAEILFNYEGRYQAMEREQTILKPESWHAGEALKDQGIDLKRFCLFEISTAILPDGQLHLTCSWNKNMRHQGRIRLWIDTLLPAAISETVSNLMLASPQLTLSDVELLRLHDYPSLDGLAQSILSIPEVRTLDDLEGVYPGSPMQDALFLSQSRSQDGAYEVDFTWRVTIPLQNSQPAVDLGCLVEAWKDTVALHAALRTVILESSSPVTGILHQVVLRSHDPAVVILDAKDVITAIAILDSYPSPTEDGLALIKRPPHRLLICNTIEGSVLIKFQVNHLVFDGMSTEKIIKDIADAYARRQSNKLACYSGSKIQRENAHRNRPAKPPLAEFVRYIRDPQRRQDSIDYWKKALSTATTCNFPALLDQATSEEVVSHQSRASIPVPLCVDSRELAQTLADLGITLSAMFQTVWAIVLRIYSQNGQSVFGYLTSGRDAPVDGIDSAVGNFIAMLVCFFDFNHDGVHTIAEMAWKIHNASANSIGHQACSLAEIQDALGLSTATPLFNTALTYLPKRSTGIQTEEAEGHLCFEEISMSDPTEFDLTLFVEPRQGSNEVSAHLQFKLSSISEAYAANIAATVAHILSELVRDPYRAFDTLPTVSKRDTEIIRGWNHRLLEPAKECIHEMFSRKVVEHPQQEAICSWDGSLTYAELSDLSRRLSTHLVTLGIGVGTKVPIFFEKSMWAIVTILAVVQAGGAFVLLEPGHPESRLWGMIKQVQARVLLCSPVTRSIGALQNISTEMGAGLKIIRIEPEFIQGLPPVPRLAHQDMAGLDDDLYVVFTSGSTGDPKGAVATHRAFATGIYEHAMACGMTSVGAPPRSLQFASYSFDASIGDIFTTFVASGCLCIPREEDRNPVGITAFINRCGVTWAGITPSFVSHLEPDAVPTLKALCVAGEPLSMSVVTAWSNRLNLINMYGPTEATVACIANRVLCTTTTVGDIGRGYRAATWVVQPDNHNSLVPIGAVGELIIEGSILCRGYLNDPERTAEVFIRSPSWLHDLRPNSTLYKTGDLVRYSADGKIIFIGRKDTQVKMNGQRFELGEVEHALQLQLDPSDGPIIVDLLKRTQSGEPDLLIAFLFVGRANTGTGNSDEIFIATSTSSLSEFSTVIKKLQDAQRAMEVLPLYMVPQAYVPVEGGLPLTAAGKIDRYALRRLCEPFSRKDLVGFASKALGTPVDNSEKTNNVEERLARIWEKVLGVKKVGRESDFFRSGGNSMAAITLRAEAQKSGFALFVADIFTNPRLADMAKLLSHGQSVSSSSSTSVTEVPMSSPQRSSSGLETATPASKKSPIHMYQNENIIDRPISFGYEEGPTDAQLKEASRICGIPPGSIEDIFPCTPMQEALVALSLIPGAQASYALHAPFELRPGLDRNRFRSAWESTVKAQPMLRSRIMSSSDGSSVVVTRGTDDVPRLVVSELDVYLEQQRLKGFSSGAPLSRLAFVHSSANDCDYFVISAHHAIYDGWSLNLIWNQVLALYNNNEMPPLGPSFKDFARKLNLAGAKLDSENFWRQSLVNPDQESFRFPDVPVGHKPATRCTTNFRFPFSMQSATGTTANTYINAAWAITMAQYSSNKTVTFGVTLWGRDFPMVDIEYVSGPTIVTIPRQVNINPDVSVADFLQSVQKAAAAALPHQHLGLHRIQALGPAARQACDFSTLLVVNDGSSLRWSELKDVDVVPVPLHSSDLYSYPMVVEVENASSNALDIRVHSDPDCIEGPLVERLMEQFGHNIQTLCRAASFAPSKRIAELMDDIATAHLRTLFSWNSQVKGSPNVAATEVHKLLEKTAQSQPAGSAVVAHDGQLSYTQMNRCADVLACQIRKTGMISAQSPFVCIHLVRSAIAVVSMLAVLKAGGAFMPVDISQPRTRLKGLIEESGARIILTLPESVNDLTTFSRSAKVLPVSLPELIEQISKDATKKKKYCESRDTEPHSPAYLLYTSGTSGKPKGVVMEHSAWSQGLACHADYMGFNPCTRMLQFSSLMFDLSILEIWAVLYAGGCLFIPSDQERVNNLQDFTRINGINTVFLTPSIGKLLQPKDLPDISFAGFIGEPMTRSLIDAWMLPGRRLVNSYGPTEACVLVTAREVSPTAPHDKPSSNIGYALGANMWVVEPQRTALVPIGAVGELCIEAPSLARCYLANPERTEYSFPSTILDSWHMKKGTRVYRTGDLARYASDGTLDFLGRKDGQIKLRGQRIELGEIEHHIRRLMSDDSRFHEASVQLFNPATDPDRDAAGDDEMREPYLAGLLVLDLVFTEKVMGIPCTSLTSDNASENLRTLVIELKRNLRSVLPHYMVPLHFVAVSRLPTGSSGKLDLNFVRACLRELTSPSGSNSPKAEQVLTTDEGVLRQWWGTVLAMDPQSIQRLDDFFSLGGSSVSAMRLVGLARSSGYKLQHEDVFMCPRLADMAGQMSFGQKASVSPRTSLTTKFDLLDDCKVDEVIDHILPQLDMNKELIEDMYPCTPLQESLMAATARHCEAYMMIQSITVHASELIQLKKAMDVVFREFEVLRTRITLGPSQQALQVVLKHGELSWESFPSVQSFKDYFYRSFGYGKPLARLAVITPALDSKKSISHGTREARTKNGRDTVIVAIGAHHSIYDAHVLAMIWRRLYREFIGGQADGVLNAETSCSEEAVPFKSYVEKLLRRKDKDESPPFWREKLRGISLSQFPPTSWPRVPEHQPSATQTLTAKASLPTSSRKKLGATVATVAYASWALTIAHYTANPDVVFGATLSGREAMAGSTSQPESIAGPTIITVPLRINVDFQSVVSDFLSTLQKDVVRAAHFGQMMGLSSIAHIDSDCRDACQYKSVLVIQVPDQDDKYDSGAANPFQMSLESIGYFPAPLVIEVELSESTDVHISMGYDPILVPKKLAHFILDTFTTIMSNLSEAKPEATVGSVPALSEAHLAELDVTCPEWIFEKAEERNRPEPQQCLQDLVCKRAQQSPKSQAIDSWDGSISYRELDELSSILAGRLSRFGVKPESPVCLLFEKSKWAVVAMIGIVKAGGCFVPLDPSYPHERLEHIVNETRASVVVTSAACSELCLSLSVRSIVLDGSVSSSAEKPPPSTPDHLPPVSVQPNHAAYILFTSGSTGKPKGVVMEHRSLCSALIALGKRMGLGPQSRVLQFNSYWFDVMLLDIFGTLVYGGCLCIPKEEQRMSNLAGWVQKFNANTMLLSTSVSRLMQPADTPSLKTLCLTGEAVLQSDVDRWADKLRLIAGYGPTETCIMSASGELAPSSPANLIGKPVSCKAWVINPLKETELAPYGATGELYIQGPTVARGYLHDDQLTSRFFIVNPPWLTNYKTKENRIALRAYKTGDLVFWGPQGSLYYVGRKDSSQIKIRGQRVELAEIEEVIRQHIPPHVTVCVDLLPSDDRNTRVILGAVLGLGDRARGGPEDHEVVGYMDDLKRHIVPALEASLPHHMIPEVYVPFVQLPTLGSGKLDRRTVRKVAGPLAFSLPQATARHPNQPMLTQAQKLLRQLWCKILSQPDESAINKHDNFLGIGGDSIAAIKLVALLRQHRISLTVAEIFTHPTLEAMSSLIEERNSNGSSENILDDVGGKTSGVLRQTTDLMVDQHSMAVQKSRECNHTTFPCIEYQEMFLAGTEAFAGAHSAQFIFRLPEKIDLGRLQAAFNHCADWYPNLRTQIDRDTDTGKFLHKISPVGTKILWSCHYSDDLNTVLSDDKKSPPGLGGPLHRITIARSHNPTESRLIWTLNHAVYDAWSLRMMLEHVAEAYANLDYEPSYSLGWTMFVLHTEKTKEASRSFWSSYLSDIKPARLMFNYKLVCNPRQDRLYEARINIPKRAISRATTATVLLAGLALLVARVCGSRDVILAHLLTGRTLPLAGIENCPGPTITKVPLRIPLTDQQLLTSDLDSVATTVAAELMQIMPHEHSGLSALREFVPQAEGTTTSSGTFHAGSLLGRLPLDLVIHPKGGRDLLGKHGLGLQQEGFRFVAPPAGGLSMECAPVDDDERSDRMRVDVAVLWDDRAATQENIMELVGWLQDIFEEGNPQA
uniref:HC-toxin synthetase n=1 Tax=Alternaria jesenskae TaxID=378183 RepID=S5FES1_9PLEO|nr:HC-toxin synthetase [Alternaria jesenskae]